MLNVQAPLMLKKKFWNFKEELELTWLRNHEARPTLGILQTVSFINDTNQLLPNNLKLDDKATDSNYQNAKDFLWGISLICSNILDIQLRHPRLYTDRSDKIKILFFTAFANFIHHSSASGEHFRKHIWQFLASCQQPKAPLQGWFCLW